MIICVDARPLVKKKVGFGFFLQNMICEILEIDKKNTYILLSDREVYFDSSKYENVRVLNYKDNFFFRKTFFYYFKLAKFLKKQNIKPDVFWGTEHIMPKGLPKLTNKVLTIHDFTHKKFPHATTKYNLLISKLFFARSIKNADIIVGISKNTTKELKEIYSKEIKEKEVVTIYEGGIVKHNGNNQQKKVDIDICNIIKEKYVLFVGTIEPRKNIKILIEAAPKLRGKAQVIVCGKIGWETSEIVEQLKNTENLTYLNYISQEEKEVLMRNCICQIQPSLYEGFGLPVVESMQEGTVALVADNSSLQELVEMKELRFATKDVDDLCKKICALIDSKSLFSKAQNYCRKRGSEFSWNKAAKEYYSIFNGENVKNFNDKDKKV